MKKNSTITGIICFLLLALHPLKAYHSGDGTIEEVPSIRQAQLIVENQKVLSQQAAKSFLGIAVNKKVPEFYLELDSARTLFDENMRRLELFAPQTPLQASTEKLRGVWDRVKVQLKKEIDKEEAEILLTLNDELFNACQLLADELGNYKNSLLPEVAGSVKQLDLLTLQAYDQAVLAQEFLLYYFADKLGVSKAFAKRMTVVEKEFETSLKKLTDATVNSAEIDANLHFVDAQWKEAMEHLKKWSPDNREYMSNLALYGNWTSDKAVKVAKQYFELAEVMSVSHLLNLASKHRAHTQELAKYHVAIAFQLGNVNLAKKDLQSSVSVFEQRIERLLLFAPTEEIRVSAETVNRFWKNYKTALTAHFDQAEVFKAIEQSHIMMAACDKVTEQIEAYAESLPTYAKLQANTSINDRTARLVNLSGRECMDLQRIPIYFVLLSKNMGGSITDSRFNEAKEQFDNTLQLLQEASLNTPKMEEQLLKIAEMWESLNNEVMNTISQQDNERLAKAIDKASEIYVKMLEINTEYAVEMNLLIERKLRG